MEQKVGKLVIVIVKLIVSWVLFTVCVFSVMFVCGLLLDWTSVGNSISKYADGNETTVLALRLACIISLLGGSILSYVHLINSEAKLRISALEQRIKELEVEKELV
jgi:hypothetical protein